jgi:hypothetical protein
VTEGLLHAHLRTLRTRTLRTLRIWRIWRTCPEHVEVEHLLPHRPEVDDVALLARVLLRDLQLDHLVGARQGGEER